MWVPGSAGVSPAAVLDRRPSSCSAGTETSETSSRDRRRGSRPLTRATLRRIALPCAIVGPAPCPRLALVRLRSAARAAAGPLPALAARPARPAAAAGCSWPASSSYDGLRGPQVGAMNLAGVLPWIHWRGFVVLGLLAAGNVFCMACPFTAAADARPPLAAARLELAAPAAEQVAGGRPARAVSLGLRGVRPLGQPLVDRLDRRRLLRRRPSSSTASSAAPPSASISARSASSTSCSRWSRRWR